MNYSQEDNLLIQSYMTIGFLFELKRLNFLDSAYYKNSDFDDKFLQKTLPNIGIDNQGTLLIALYTMLVIPKELIEEKYTNDFKNLNDFIQSITLNAESTYKRDKDEQGNPNINYVRHIRNSVSHAKVEFTPTNEVVFKDDYNNQTCTITISLEKIGTLLTEIRKIFFKHVESMKQDIKTGKNN
ncbi:HEPN family nuclease [Psychrobacter celer]|uniref:HEPN family nuclease n=1 Tax=Psychrobacter celer TaxID=306572 RepID=UPI0018DF1B69|nr:HEPN family nuclease [Psychrobacter celer]